MNHRTVLMVTLIFFSINLKKINAQEHQIGFSTQIGKTTILDESESIALINPLSKKKDNKNYALKLNYFLTPNYSIFRIKTGIGFLNKKLNLDDLDYIEIPLGLEFVIGKKLNLLTGFSFSYRKLINKKNYATVIYNYENNVFSYEINLGLEYKLNNNFNFNIIYLIDKDINSSFFLLKTNPTGIGTSSINMKTSDGGIRVGVIYKLFKKK